MVNSLGFVTPYGSSEIREDFAETIANYITKTDAEWELIWRNASRGFWTDGDETSQDMSTLTYYTYFYYENNEVNEEKRKGTIFENIEFKDDGTMTLRGQSQRGKGTSTKQDDGTYLDEDGKLVDRQGFLLDSGTSTLMNCAMQFKLVLATTPPRCLSRFASRLITCNNVKSFNVNKIL